MALVRIGTSPVVFPNALSVDEAIELIDDWLKAPNAVIVHPTARHLDLLQGLLAETGAAANLSSDAHLAALALEHGAEVVTFDRDFGRFACLKWRLP